MKMVFSDENVKGIVLALLSSGFIGTSFIIKKKGLIKAAAVSGVRAGVGGYSYLLEPLWWIGLITMIIGEIANFVAYAFAPAVLVTPLGALSIIVSTVLAHFMLNEKVSNLGMIGCIMCIVGSVIIVIHAPAERPIGSVKEIWIMATQPAFLLYVGSVIVLVFILVLYFAPQCGHTNVLVFTGICSLMGSLTALDTFNTALVSPIYYVMFTSLTILASVIMFKDWDGQSGENILSELCGFLVVLSGSVLLDMNKDIEKSSSSSKGGYIPVSPTLSSQLYNGNGDLRYDEENFPDEEFYFREH